MNPERARATRATRNSGIETHGGRLCKISARSEPISLFYEHTKFYIVFLKENDPKIAIFDPIFFSFLLRIFEFLFREPRDLVEIYTISKEKSKNSSIQKRTDPPKLHIFATSDGHDSTSCAFKISQKITKKLTHTALIKINVAVYGKAHTSSARGGVPPHTSKITEIS